MQICTEPGGDALRAMFHEVVRRMIEHVESIDTQPACGPVSSEATKSEIARLRSEPIPEAPCELEGVLDDLLLRWIPASFTTAGPGYLAYIPGGGVLTAALADLVADVTNRFTGLSAAAPCLVELEAAALRWLCGLMGFRPSASGLFTTGGSMANFCGIVAARERHLGASLEGGTLYTSDQVHHSVVKAARMAGIPPSRVIEVPSDPAFRMRVDALADLITQDRSRGLRPFLVVSTAGTTNTGAVDPMVEIRDLCRREGLWHHVDGAYGAFFRLCEPLRETLAGMSDADSLTLDPHKGLFLPYGTGALLVQDPETLRRAFGSAAGYLPASDAEAYEPHQMGPDLSRGFPGLRVWLTLKLLGLQAFRELLIEKRRLALWAAEEVRRTEGLVLACEPELSLFAFHVRRGGALADENAATRELLHRVRDRGRVMLSGCQVRDRTLARICVLNFRTHEARMRAGIDDLRAALQEIEGSRGPDAGQA